jgi:transcriptional regulator with XRE-family HTH domain
MDESRDRVAARIRKIRDEHTLTQEEAAARAGVGLRQWQRWEHGKSQPYRSNIERLIREFGVSPADFYEAATAGEDRLERIEAKLDRVLDALGVSSGLTDEELAEEAARAAEEVAARLPKQRGRPGSARRARGEAPRER